MSLTLDCFCLTVKTFTKSNILLLTFLMYILLTIFTSDHLWRWVLIVNTEHTITHRHTWYAEPWPTLKYYWLDRTCSLYKGLLFWFKCISCIRIWLLGEWCQRAQFILHWHCYIRSLTKFHLKSFDLAWGSHENLYYVFVSRDTDANTCCQVFEDIWWSVHHELVSDTCNTIPWN